MEATMSDSSAPNNSLMKALPPFFTLALAGSILLMSVHPLQAQPPTPPKTTDVLVLMTQKAGVPREELAKVLPSEVRATVRLYLDGKLRQWFQRSDGKGVVFILPATTVADAQAIMDSLPLPRANLVDLEYVALSPLGPLAALLGPTPDK
jgi:hypothetical protein